MPFSPLVNNTLGGRRHYFGTIAWAGLATYVVIYDIVAVLVGAPTLSATFHKFSVRRWGRVALIAFWSYLTAHLFRWLPPRYDLFRSLDRPVTRHKRASE